MLSFPMLRLLLPPTRALPWPTGGLQRSADPLLISSYLRREKRPLSFCELNLGHKNGSMTKCLEKLLQEYHQKNISCLVDLWILRFVFNFHSETFKFQLTLLYTFHLYVSLNNSWYYRGLFHPCDINYCSVIYLN